MNKFPAFGQQESLLGRILKRRISGKEKYPLSAKKYPESKQEKHPTPVRAVKELHKSRIRVDNSNNVIVIIM